MSRAAVVQSAGRSAPTRPEVSREYVWALLNERIHLTFDDGPDIQTANNNTEKVLDTLKRRGIRATFFVVRKSAETPVGRKLVARMRAEHHRVSIHSAGKSDHDRHTTLARRDYAGFKGDLAQMRDELDHERRAADPLGPRNDEPIWVRPPYMASNRAVDEAYQQAQLRKVLWDVNADQKEEVKGEKVLDLGIIKRNIDKDLKLLRLQGWPSKKVGGNVVILLHDIRPETADVINEIIDYLEVAFDRETAVRPYPATAIEGGAGP